MSEEKKIYEQDYSLPENRDQLVDLDAGKVVDKKDLDPMEIIRATAKHIGTEIRDPDSGCKKCYGRGYIGRVVKTGEPVMCSCLFRGKTPAQQKAESMVTNGAWNRKQKRDMMKTLRKKMKKHGVKKNKAEEYAVADAISTSATDISATSGYLQTEDKHVDQDEIQTISI